MENLIKKISKVTKIEEQKVKKWFDNLTKREKNAVVSLLTLGIASPIVLTGMWGTEITGNIAPLLISSILTGATPIVYHKKLKEVV